MPVGRKMKLGVATAAVAVLGVFASSASANDVWLWACHGPDGQAIASSPDAVPRKDARLGTYGSGCAADSSQSDTGGLRLEFAGDEPAGESSVAVSFRALGGLPVKAVRINRRTTGFDSDSGSAVNYSATLDSAGSIESLPLGQANLSGEKPFDTAGGNTLTLRLGCDQAAACDAPNAGVEVSSLRLLVSDTTGPTGGVGRNSPVGTDLQKPEMRLTVTARDEGVGLDRAELWVDGARVASSDFDACADLSPATPQVDLPLTDNCPAAGSVELIYNTADMANGLHRRTVAVYDAAGNVSNLVNNEVFEVFHPDPPISTRTLSIGSAGISIDDPSQNPSGPNGTNPGGGVAGAGAGSCRSPRLSITLKSKPLRVGKRIAVLQFGKKYKFSGRLTCVVNNKRVSAPKRTAVRLQNKIGKKLYTRKAVRVGNKGRLNFTLKYPVGSRTLIFRYVSGNTRSQAVNIRIKTERKKKAAKR